MDCVHSASTFGCGAPRMRKPHSSRTDGLGFGTTGLPGRHADPGRGKAARQLGADPTQNQNTALRRDEIVQGRRKLLFANALGLAVLMGSAGVRAENTGGFTPPAPQLAF